MSGSWLLSDMPGLICSWGYYGILFNSWQWKKQTTWFNKFHQNLVQWRCDWDYWSKPVYWKKKQHTGVISNDVSQVMPGEWLAMTDSLTLARPACPSLVQEPWQASANR